MRQQPWASTWDKGNHLGQGGQGRTYMARRIGSSSQEQYVLKVLLRQDDPKRRARMYQEVANLKRLSHSNVAKFVDSNFERYQEGEELYLVTEFISGPNLAEFVATNPPDILLAAEIVASLLMTLEHCHAAGIVHRDIKPDNIILRAGKTTDPALLDFGLSFNEETQPTDFQTSQDHHLGNRFIVLPEYGVSDSDKRDPRSDITQCVGILFFILTGLRPGNIIDARNQKPHTRATAAATLQKYPMAVTTCLSRIFDMGFNHEFQRRWQSIPSLVAEIRKLRDPEPAERESLDVLLQHAKQQLLQTPSMVVQERIHLLQQDIAKIFSSTCDSVHRGLQGAIQGVRAQNDPKLNPLTASCWRMSFRHAAKPAVVYGFCAKLERAEVLIFALNEGGLAQLLTRFGIFDDEGPMLTKSAIEDHIANQLLPQWTS